VTQALVILAGGASRRLGQCKALVEWSGVTTLERLARAGAAFDALRPLVVAGADLERIAARTPRGVECVFNPHWAQGRTSSVLAARDARPGMDLCIAPVDTPLVEAEVFALLASSWARAGAPERGWLAPCTTQEPRRFGHPIVIGRGLLGELDAGESLRELRARAAPLLHAPCAFESILDDLDTPEDLSLLRRRAAGAG
jgi:CTP:molybdopterin cytidylyltransferase MocA